MTELRQTNIKMPPALIERLDAESKRTGAPKSEIVRRAVDAYLRRLDSADERPTQGAERSDAVAPAVA
jgi:predicted DNA-binding protein